MSKAKQIVVTDDLQNVGEAVTVEIPDPTQENIINTQVELSQPPAPVRVLVDCAHGRCNDVVTLTQAEIKAGVLAGIVDPDPNAVAAAQT